jgi:hypothetical protein
MGQRTDETWCHERYLRSVRPSVVDLALGGSNSDSYRHGRVPECSVEFGAIMPQSSPPYAEFWVRSSSNWLRSHRRSPTETTKTYSVSRVTTSSPSEGPAAPAHFSTTRLSGYELASVPIRASTSPPTQDGWGPSGPRGRPDSGRAVSQRMQCIFLLDGRDGYIEILASGFAWRAWRPGRPMRGAVSGDPVMSGAWPDGDSRI